MMWGKGKLMNSGRREWKVNIVARLHAETYHTQSIAERGTFGNMAVFHCRLSPTSRYLDSICDQIELRIEV